MHAPTLSAILGLTLAYLASPVWADTEIRNFRLPLSTPQYDNLVPEQLILLDSSTRQLTLNVSKSQPELYVRLGIEEAYDNWTVRLSWPGSSPTKFDLSIHPLQPQHLKSLSRHALLRISARPLSVPIPIYPISIPIMSWLSSLLHPTAPQPDPLSSSRDKGHTAEGHEWATTIHLVLEPLILGALPRTAVPAICLILVFGGGAAWCVPSIIRFLEGLREMSVGIEDRKMQ